MRPDFPSARVGFTKVAGVFSRLDAFAPPTPGDFVDPVALANATSAALVTGVVPTSVVVVHPGQPMHEAWRESVWELFENSFLEGPSGASTSLTQVLASVLGAPGAALTNVTIESCPGRHDNECLATNLPISITGSRCPQCDTPLFFTDITNTQDEVRHEGSNLTALGRLMSRRTARRSCGRCESSRPPMPGASSPIAPSFSTALSPCSGGRLASSAMLSASSRRSTRRTSSRETRHPRGDRDREDRRTCRTRERHPRAHPARVAVRLPDPYIRERIQHRKGNRAYGYDTDYGRRFIYRARDSRTMVFSTPPLPFGETTDDSAAVDLRRLPLSSPQLPGSSTRMGRFSTATRSSPWRSPTVLQAIPWELARRYSHSSHRTPSALRERMPSRRLLASVTLAFRRGPTRHGLALARARR